MDIDISTRGLPGSWLSPRVQEGRVPAPRIQPNANPVDQKKKVSAGTVRKHIHSFTWPLASNGDLLISYGRKTSTLYQVTSGRSESVIVALYYLLLLISIFLSPLWGQSSGLREESNCLVSLTTTSYSGCQVFTIHPGLQTSYLTLVIRLCSYTSL